MKVPPSCIRLIFSGMLVLLLASGGYAQSAVDLRFSGVAGIPEEQLRVAAGDILSSISARGLTPPRADDTAFYVEVYYRRQGYTYAVVNWQIENGGRTLSLQVEEGPLTKLGKVTWQGNDNYEEAILNDFLVGTTRERFSQFKTSLPYVEQEIDTGIARLIAFYQSEGYLDAQVWPWPMEYTADLSEARPGYTVVEGLRYWFRDIRVLGVTPEQESVLQPILLEAKLKPASEQTIETLRGDAQQRLRSRGYFNAKATLAASAWDVQRGVLDIGIIVEPGEIYSFDGITVKGVERLRDSFLPARFSLLTGRRYDPELLDEIYREVITTGLFSELRMKETLLPGNLIRLDFRVTENPAKEVNFYAGFGTYEGGFIGAGYQDRNLFGNGRPLLTAMEFSQRGIVGRIEYTDPWFLGRGNELKARIFSRSFDNEGYSVFDLGLRVDVNRQFGKKIKAGVFLSSKLARTEAEEIDPLLLGPLDYTVQSIGLTATYDERNNPLSPAAGWVADVSVSYDQISTGAVGLRTSFRLTWYQPLGRGLLAIGMRTSAFLTSGDIAEVPIDERYFTGGGTTVRSFGERELGPRFLNEFPLGGLSRTLLNAEFVHPIFGDIKGAVFIDAGNIPQDGALLSTSDFRYGVGVGLRYDLPIGPIRIDYGFNPDAREGEAAGAFHLSFGVAF